MATSKKRKTHAQENTDMGTPVQLTADQFRELLSSIATQSQSNEGPGWAAGAAAMAGQIPPCHLGRNKVKRYKHWADWLRDAEAKISFLKIQHDDNKLDFLRSCAGTELTEFWAKEARIRFVGGQPGEPQAHTYSEVLTETKAALLKIINRDRAIMDLLRLDQGNRSFTEFISEVEDQEFLCQTEDRPITGNDLKRISLLAGMKDRNLAEKAIAEEYTLEKVIQAGINRESSRANVEAMQTKQTDNVNRMAQSGKYSARYKTPEHQRETRRRCKMCTYEHVEGRCPAEGRKCNACGEMGHFVRAKLCKSLKTGGSRKKFTARRVEELSTSDSYSSDEGQSKEVVARIDREWPGVRKDSRETRDMYKIKDGLNKESKRVQLRLGGRAVTLYCDTGSALTIIPPELYREAMGKVVPAKTHLRAWGSDTRLDTKGMFRTTLETKQGARKATWVYIVAGTRPEPLLGDADAEDLGIIEFHPEGRPPTALEENEQIGRIESSKASIPARLRRTGKQVSTKKPDTHAIDEETKQEAQAIVDAFKGTVLTERIGDMNIKPIQLQYEEGFRPIQPARYPVPHHYREQLTTHLTKLKKEGIVEDVNPSEPIDCVLNIAISTKKNSQIRMNIDARPLNVGAKHTKYHVPTPQEIRHQLEGATVFTELDMGNGFHQLPLAKESQIIFQSHEGLHRMKRLFFGPKNSSGVFHHEVQKAFSGVPGCITLHDNVLVHGRNGKEHNNNLKAVLKRAKEKGVTFKPTQNTICAPEVKWFGRIFSQAGISADPEKIKGIIEAGRPTNSQDVKSLLQAAAYNAKFAYDHTEDVSYEEVTAPLRELLKKGVRFSWDRRREKCFQQLMGMLNDRAILTPFIMGRKTHLVSDASPHGISASIYQEDEEGRWLPVDHASRALSEHEQAWKSQIDWESLAKMWGMTIFRQYLVGQRFTSWGDQRPLIPLYNDFTKQAPARVNKHRNKVVDLTFTDKYLPGRYMPADFNSRHPEPITHLSKHERENLQIDDGEDIQVMRVIMGDLPPALTTKMIREVASRDTTYQKLIKALRQGKKPADRELMQYTSVWDELTVMEDLVLRSERIVIPDGLLPNDEGNLREWIVELGHSGHMGTGATKRLLRLRLWFPGMDRLVERRVKACLPCQAATENHTRDPLKPNPAPKEPWQRLYCDHWGPIDNKHILVIIDALTRYPEVMVVKGTSAEQNIQAFSETFARHGVPKYLHSDNGPPFNGSDSHLLQEYFRSMGVSHITNHSAQDPESTGLVEAFMKHLKKIFHTAVVAKEDPYLQINTHLMQFRATPHPTTGKSPAELLFGRKFHTTLPDLRKNPAAKRTDILEARGSDATEKQRMKAYKDSRNNVRPHCIKHGDKVLLKRKSNKRNSPYDPVPYTVTEIWGTQIQAEREGRTKTRDAQRWKKIYLYKKQKGPKGHDADTGTVNEPDIGANSEEQSPNRRDEEEPTEVHEDERELQEDYREEETTEVQVHGEEESTPTNIVTQLRTQPGVIISDTPANRPARSRIPIRRYEGENWKKAKEKS